jgi:hypothetical protein
LNASGINNRIRRNMNGKRGEERGPGLGFEFPGEGGGRGEGGNTTPQYLQYVFFSDIRVLI